MRARRQPLRLSKHRAIGFAQEGSAPKSSWSDRSKETTMKISHDLLAAALIVALAVTTAQAQPTSKAMTATGIAAPGKGTEGIVKLTDASIEYFSRGKGEAIVLLPGGTLTVGYLDGLADALAKAGYRVVGINFRGSGKSTGTSEGVTLQTFADDVAGVVKALKLGPVHMAGNDYGNRVARMFAASHPELTRSVILLAAGGKIPPKPDAARALGVIFNPASTEPDILAVMNYLVANQADAARV
jgi:pimeloyl-ACP methyl ester carboxylesterase